MNGDISLKDKITKTGVLPLDIPFCALLCWKACYIRFSFYTQERTGLAGWENKIFIVLCAGYTLGLVAYALIGPRFHVNMNNDRVSYYLATAAAILCTVLSANTWMAVSMLFTFLSSFFAAYATGRCLHRLALSLRRSRLGLFFGVSLAISEAIMALLFLQTFLRLPVDVVTAALCLLLAVAGITFRPAAGTEEEQEEVADPPPKSKTMFKFAIILFVYCGVAGILDNLYAFDGIFRAIPLFMQCVYLYSICINLLAGFIFDRTNWRTAVMVSISLICAGQALSFFSSIEALAIPYIALTTLGIVAMEVYLVALPVYYARDTKRPGLVCCLGLFAQYLGYGSTSVLFEFFPKDLYMSVLGIVLVAAIVILLLLFVASGAYETEKAAARLANKGGVRIESLEGYSLTPREGEICIMILQGISEKQISSKLGITEATVRFHRTRLYRKMHVNGLQELFAKFLGDIQFTETISTKTASKV